MGQLVLARLRKASRELLKLEPKDPKKLDYVLGLTLPKLMERRLQTRVWKSGLARSIHHARVLIRHRHIRVGKNLVNIPSFMVRENSEKMIDITTKSPFISGNAPGRTKK